MSVVGRVNEDASLEWSCFRKKAYPLHVAERVARRIREERDADVIAYGCSNCGQYHVGRRPHER